MIGMPLIEAQQNHQKTLFSNAWLQLTEGHSQWSKIV